MARMRVAAVLALSAISAILLLGGSLANAQDAASSDVYEYVESRKGVIHSTVVGDYEQAVRDNPGDVVVALRHCDAIEYFAYSDDLYREDALTEAEACKEAVHEQYAAHIEVLLQELRIRADESVTDDIRKLVDNNRGSYNPSQTARLFVRLMEIQQYVNDNPGAAGAACLRALSIDAAVDCRLIAADHLRDRGEIDRAITILESPLDSNTEPYHRVIKIQKLAELGADDAVARQFARLDDESLHDHLRVELSTSLTAAGLRDEALAVLGGVSGEYWNKSQLLQAQFDLAMAMGNFEAAHGYYYERQELDFWNDPLLRQRFELAGADLSLGWRWVDLLGLGALIAAIGAVVLLALLVPAGVHYRGLVRRNKGRVAGLAESTWTLSHAAYAIFLLLFFSVFSLYVFEYDLFFAAYFGEQWQEPDWLDADWGKMFLVNTVSLTVLLSPFVLLKGRWRRLGPGNWSILQCIGVGFGLAIVMRLLFVIPVALNPELQVFGETMLTPEAVRRLYVGYGLITALVVTAVLVPLVEEIAFRGMLLQGFSRHVTYFAANLLQSLIFAGLHESWLLFPVFVVFAFVAGVIVRRAGGLLPVIVMHGVFNAMAVLGMVAITGR